MSEKVVGTVIGLWRYPVKSMAAEGLAGVDVSWDGLAGDRRWAFIRHGMVRSGFPWLTQREHPGMAHYRPRFETPDRPKGSAVLVSTPGGRELDVADPALAEELGENVRLIKQDRGVFDTMPLSILSTGSVASLSARVEAPLDPLRFRPNLLIQTIDEGFPEDGWVGASLRVGSLRLRVDKRDQRCVMVNVDPSTLEKNPAVLRTIGREREACFGVYGSTVTPGTVAIGDPVVLDG